MLHRRVLAVVLCTSAALVSMPAAAGMGGFLKIDGIAGSSSDADHPSWIRLNSFSWNDPSKPTVEQTAAYGQAAPTSGKGTLTITKAAADAVPVLQQLCRSKDVISEVILSHPRESLPRTFMRRGGGELRERYPAFLHFKLKNVSVDKCVRVQGAESEVMSLRFESIEWQNAKPPSLPAQASAVVEGQ